MHFFLIIPIEYSKEGVIMVNMVNPASSQIPPDRFPAPSALKTEDREQGLLRSSKHEEQKSNVRLENLVMSINDMKRLFLIMLPGKVYVPAEKGQIIDIKY